MDYEYESCGYHQSSIQKESYRKRARVTLRKEAIKVFDIHPKVKKLHMVIEIGCPLCVPGSVARSHTSLTDSISRS